jgi:carboxylesterase type B
MSTILKHGKLGEIHGVLGDDVVQFLGIQYASLKDRFAKSEILDRDLDSSVIDATRIG